MSDVHGAQGALGEAVRSLEGYLMISRRFFLSRSAAMAAAMAILGPKLALTDERRNEDGEWKLDPPDGVGLADPHGDELKGNGYTRAPVRDGTIIFPEALGEWTVGYVLFPGLGPIPLNDGVVDVPPGKILRLTIENAEPPGDPIEVTNHESPGAFREWMRGHEPRPSRLSLTWKGKGERQ